MLRKGLCEGDLLICRSEHFDAEQSGIGVVSLQPVMPRGEEQQEQMPFVLQKRGILILKHPVDFQEAYLPLSGGDLHKREVVCFGAQDPGRAICLPARRHSSRMALCTSLYHVPR